MKYVWTLSYFRWQQLKCNTFHCRAAVTDSNWRAEIFKSFQNVHDSREILKIEGCNLGLSRGGRTEGARGARGSAIFGAEQAKTRLLRILPLFIAHKCCAALNFSTLRRPYFLQDRGVQLHPLHPSNPWKMNMCNIHTLMLKYKIVLSKILFVTF